MKYFFNILTLSILSSCICLSGYARSAFEHPDPGTISLINSEHPRLWLDQEKSNRLRDNWTNADSKNLSEIKTAILNKSNSGTDSDKAVVNAFLYNATSDISYAAIAVDLALNIDDSIVEKKMYNAYCDPVALVFDWCFDQLDANQKSLLIAKLNNRASTINPTADEWQRFDEKYIWYVSIAIAIDGETGADPNLVQNSHNIVKNYVDMMNEIGKGSGVRHIYSTHAYRTNLLVFLWSLATNRNFAEECSFVKDYPKWVISHLARDKTNLIPHEVDERLQFRYGLESFGFLEDSTIRKSVAYLYADFFNDPLYQWLANSLEKWGGNFNDTASSPVWLGMIFYDHQRQEVSPSLSDPGLSAYFEGIGSVHFRSGWNFEGDAGKDVHAWFYCGRREGWSHNQANQNHFQIWRGDDGLAIKGGARFKGTGDDYANIYFKNSIARNTLSFAPEGSTAGGTRDIEGGQDSYSAPNSVYPFTTALYGWGKSLGDRGSIVYFEDKGNYAVTTGDASKAYSQVNYFLRDFIYIRPDLFIINDRFENSVPLDNVRWILHSKGKPLFNGVTSILEGNENAGILETPDSKEFRVIYQNSKLDALLVHPYHAKMKAIGGASQYDALVDGIDYNPDLADAEKPSYNLSYVEDQWRTEIEVATGDANGQIVTMLCVTDASDTGTKPYLVSSDVSGGKKLNITYKGKSFDVFLPNSSLGFPVVTESIIPFERKIDWKPGIPGGVPQITTIFADVKEDYGAIGDGVNDDTAAIQNAIDDCPEGQVVYIPEGIYKTSGMLTIFNKGIVLRGAGPDKTKILNYDTSNNPVIRMNRWPMYGEPIDILSGYGKESVNMTVSNASSLAVGDHIIVSQLNDPSFVTIAGNNGDGTWLGENGERTMSQINRIIGISGNDLLLERPLYFTFDALFAPQIKIIHLMSNGGIEDLYLEQINAPPGKEGSNIYMGACTDCWVKNVHSLMTSDAHVYMNGCYKCEVRDSYFFDAFEHYGGDGYGIFLFGRNSDNLIENNIIIKTRHAMAYEGGGSGNVFAYNFCNEGLDSTSPTWLTHDAITHGAHPYMNLWEGNVHDKIGLDNIWGSSSHNTFLRNYVDRKTSVSDNGIWAVDIEKNNYYHNLVGNILCHEGCSGAYEFGEGESRVCVYKLGYNSPGDSSGPIDPKVAATLLRHGNFDYVTNTTIWDQAVSNHTIPESLYLSGKPIWFDDVPFPPIGPDVTEFINKIPAQVRYENMANQTFYTLNVISSHGSIQKTPDQISYPSGSTVRITAVPSSGYQFASWLGDIAGNDNPATVIMDGNKTISASFVLSPPENSIVARYSFEQNANDVSGNDLNGAVLGSPSYVSDSKEGSHSIYFNGTIDAVQIEDNDSLDLSNALTLACWVKPFVVNVDSYAVYKSGAYFLDVTRNWDNSPHFYYYINGASHSISGSSEMQANTWYHLAVTYDSVSGLMKIFVNGIKENEKVLSGDQFIDKTANDLFVGRASFDSYYHGNIDDLRLYNFALSETEVESLFNEAGQNQIPVIAPLSPVNVYEGETISFSIHASDPDDDPVSISVSNKPLNAVFTDNGDGTATFLWQTDFSSSGNYTVIFAANDGQACSGSIDVNLTVDNVSSDLNLIDKPVWFKE